MRHSLLLLSLAALLPAQTPQATPAGHWVSNLQVFDQNNYDRLELELHGSKVTGKLGDQVFEGTFQNGQIKGTAKNLQLEGRVTSSTIKGTAINTKFKEEFHWEATREAIANSEAPKTHTFEPTEFHHFFSSAIKPALRIHPGDTVRTWSVDAGGTDAKGVRRTSGGNPLTGPFYIEGALPGDTLAIHFTKIRLNRDTAISSPLITGNALTPDYVQERKPADDYNANWQLDRNAGVAFLQKPTAALQNFKVPLAPMLGCVGVAPPGGAQYRSGYLGNFGGNMDYNQLREGVTVFLPVYNPGALLFVGDGHALQGAGELTGNALETSMDIEFTSDLIKGNSAPAPRMENENYLMASGIDGSMEEAFREATTNLVRWLEYRYKLNPAEVSSVLGTSIIYEVAEVVDPQIHIVAKVPKSALQTLNH